MVEINGVEFRALGAEKMRELQKQKAELEATKQINGELNIQIKEALLQRDLAQAQRDLIQAKSDSFEKDFNRAREDSERWHSLFISERELRQSASQFVPHLPVKGFWGKLLTAMDHPAFQLSWKLIPPAYQMLRCQ